MTVAFIELFWSIVWKLVDVFRCRNYVQLVLPGCFFRSDEIWCTTGYSCNRVFGTPSLWTRLTLIWPWSQVLVAPGHWCLSFGHLVETKRKPELFLCHPPTFQSQREILSGYDVHITPLDTASTDPLVSEIPPGMINLYLRAKKHKENLASSDIVTHSPISWCNWLTMDHRWGFALMLASCLIKVQR